MKVIAVNGSPRRDGNTFDLLSIMTRELETQGIETEMIQLGAGVSGCIACAACRRAENHLCAIGGDILNETVLKLREADGMILGAPTYYGGIAGSMKCFLDRVFYTSSRYFQYKVGAAVTAVRRAGGVDVIHQINNYFNLAEMIISPSQYWQAVYGAAKGETVQDEEGIQTVIKNARAMAWLIKTLDAAKTLVEPPPTEHRKMTNFIR